MSRLSDWLLRYLDKHGTTSRVKSPEGVPRYMESAVTEAEYQAWVAEQRILRAAEREAATREGGDA